MDFQGFDTGLMQFLGQLKRKNNRAWFEKNKARYETAVREPVLAFIRDIAPRIDDISPHILVSDSRVGGSMMRPYRDIRFTSSKLPYKTNVGVQFRHERADDIHAPGFYLHMEPGEFWLAVGMWKPDAESLGKIRQQIAESPRTWRTARDNARFRHVWEITGDALTRPPRGFDPDHPLMEDIKRKEFLGLHDMGLKDLYRPDLVKRVAASYAAAKPFMKFLCNALNLEF